MSVKLGVAPIAWSNDDIPDLGGDTPIETCLLEANVTVEAKSSELPWLSLEIVLAVAGAMIITSAHLEREI